MGITRQVIATVNQAAAQHKPAQKSTAVLIEATAILLVLAPPSGDLDAEACKAVLAVAKADPDATVQQAAVGYFVQQL
eukprot:3873245-Prymnesium_polylepis.1